MELLNISFAILLCKVCISFLPIVLGIYLVSCPVESKRVIRNKICMALFGVNNAIPYSKFARGLRVAAVLLFVFGTLVSWILLFRELLLK